MIDQKSMLVTELNKNVNIQGGFPNVKSPEVCTEFTMCSKFYFFQTKHIFLNS